MEKIYVLCNPKSGNGTGEWESRKLEVIEKHELQCVDVTTIESYSKFLNSINKQDKVILTGGDGTLNRFLCEIAGSELKNPIYYYATGSGNDFLNDLERKKGEMPFIINEFLQDAPVVTVQGKEYCFINGIGGGLDAYACAIGNKQHEMGKKSNYVINAIKGILYDYKPMNVKAVVDGEEYSFKNVWFASVMKGRFFGGGIMLAPNQDRKSGKLSLVVVHTVGRLRLLPIIPGAFKGKHVKYTKYVTVIEGNNIEVKFDRLVHLQVDGETFSDIDRYDVNNGENKHELETELIS